MDQANISAGALAGIDCKSWCGRRPQCQHRLGSPASAVRMAVLHRQRYVAATGHHCRAHRRRCRRSADRHHHSEGVSQEGRQGAPRRGRHGVQCLHRIRLGRCCGEPDSGRHDRPRDVQACPGYAMFVSAPAVARIGRFDDGFNPYGWEDVDFSLRARQSGFRIVYAPAAVVFHAGGRVGRGPVSAYETQKARQLFRLVRRNSSPLQWCCFLLLFPLPGAMAGHARDCCRQSAGRVRLAEGPGGLDPHARSAGHDDRAPKRRPGHGDLHRGRQPRPAHRLARSGTDAEFPRLRDAAALLPLRSVASVSSGSIWPSFVTGTMPERHGQFFTHMQLEPGSYRIGKRYADDITLPPFWDAGDGRPRDGAGRRSTDPSEAWLPRCPHCRLGR